MKKVLSVALASAMVLGMGANAFAIQYNTGSNDKADWPDNFKFDGALFVTDKNGDIITDATTDINDNEAVDFQPGDVIWMPLYADDQYAYSNTWTEGKDELDAVSSLKLDETYFVGGKEGSAPSVGVKKDHVKDLGTVEVKKTNTGAEVTLGADVHAKTQIKYNDKKTEASVSFKISPEGYEKLFGEKAPKTYEAVDVTVKFPVTGELKENDVVNVNVGSVVIGTVTENASNGTAAEVLQIKEVPTVVEVTNGDGDTVKRDVESAKAVVNGKTFSATLKQDADFAELEAKINNELQKAYDAGKVLTAKDVTVTVNLAKVDGTDDVIGKPHIDKVENGGVKVGYGHYTGNIDKNWSINLIEKSTGVSELVEKAELYKATATDYASYSKYTDEIMPKAVYLKVTLKKEWKTVSDETMKYYVYVSDNDGSDKTNEVWVSGKYAPTTRTVDFTWTNDANEPALWEAKESGVAVFDFADKAFFTVKMYKGETMYLDLETAYDKAIAGEMDADADSFYKFDKSNSSFSRAGELVIVSDDETLVPYEIDEDGNFVAVDAEYVKDYAIAHTNSKVNGFVFNTKQLGNYVLATEELGEDEEPADEEDKNDVEEPTPDVDETPAPQTDKPNPNTGANDFVGLAVSLAVVSVAAAGALALKK